MPLSPHSMTSDGKALAPSYAHHCRLAKKTGFFNPSLVGLLGFLKVFLMPNQQHCGSVV